MQIEKFVPGPLKNYYRRLRSTIKNGAFGSNTEEIFDSIYKDKCWGSESPDILYSGPGTYDPATTEYISFIWDFIQAKDIRTITEIGCGDFSIGRQYADKVDRYLGVDVSQLVVSTNSERYGTSTITFLHADASKNDLPGSDLCLIRQVFQHLDNESIKNILEKAKVHRYLLVTEHLPNPDVLDKPNVNKSKGPDTRLIFDSGVYVDLPPFSQDSQIVLTLPVEKPQAHAGEIMRTSLISNR